MLEEGYEDKDVEEVPDDFMDEWVNNKRNYTFIILRNKKIKGNLNILQIYKIFKIVFINIIFEILKYQKNIFPLSLELIAFSIN